jgi:patatin-like phospholipase
LALRVDGSTDGRAAVAARIAESQFDAEDLMELRIAVVMTGGVSLAVWMGGVTLELSRLVRAEDRTYLKLLRLTRSRPRVDVISGTSAGGLNGALLATALVRGATVAGLRDLWLDLGALERLLRRARVADPPSLLRGDDCFLPEIRKAIGRLGGPGTHRDAVPMELIISGTLLREGGAFLRHPRAHGRRVPARAGGRRVAGPARIATCVATALEPTSRSTCPATAPREAGTRCWSFASEKGSEGGTAGGLLASGKAEARVGTHRTPNPRDVGRAPTLERLVRPKSASPGRVMAAPPPAGRLPAESGRPRQDAGVVQQSSEARDTAPGATTARERRALRDDEHTR